MRYIYTLLLLFIFTGCVNKDPNAMHEGMFSTFTLNGEVIGKVLFYKKHRISNDCYAEFFATTDLLCRKIKTITCNSFEGEQFFNTLTEDILQQYDNCSVTKREHGDLIRCGFNFFFAPINSNTYAKIGRGCYERFYRWE